MPACLIGLVIRPVSSSYCTQLLLRPPGSLLSHFSFPTLTGQCDKWWCRWSTEKRDYCGVFHSFFRQEQWPPTRCFMFMVQLSSGGEPAHQYDGLGETGDT